MTTVEKVSVALTHEQVALLKAAVGSGEYATASEAVREALRDWQAKRLMALEQREQLRQMWLEGKMSGEATALDMGALRREARERLSEKLKSG